MKIMPAVLKVGEVASPSGRLVGESRAAASRRQFANPTSPGGARDRTMFVPRRLHSLNVGTPFRLGHPDKVYHPGDFASPICDSLHRLHRRQGFVSTARKYDEIAPTWVTFAASDLQAVPKSFRVKQDRPDRVCSNCDTTDPANIVLDSDRCNYTCSACGAIQLRTNRKANNRERACAADEDRTTRGDAYAAAPSRFDIAFKSVSESRRHLASTAVESSFVSQKAKKRFRLGYAHESTTRAAVLASEARSRMSQKQHSKNAQLIISLERLFDQLEPIDGKLKRHLRVEIDRAFRASVLHCSACHQGCTLNLETRTNSGVAIALISVSLQRLLDGRENLDALSQAHILAVRDRVARCDASVHSAARAVQVALHTLLDSHSEAVALPPCMCDAIEGGASQEPLINASLKRGKSKSIRTEEPVLDDGRQSISPSPHSHSTVRSHEHHLQVYEGGSPSMKRARKACCPPAAMTGEWQQPIAKPDADSITMPIIGNPFLSSPAISSLSNTSLASAASAASVASTVQMAKSKTLPLAPSPAPSSNSIPQLSVKRLQASLEKIWALMPSSPQTQATANRLVTETLFGQTMSKAVHLHGIKSTVLLAIFIDILGRRLGRVSEAPEEIQRLATSKVKSVVLNEMEAFLPSKVETTAEFF